VVTLRIIAWDPVGAEYLLEPTFEGSATGRPCRGISDGCWTSFIRSRSVDFYDRLVDELMVFWLSKGNLYRNTEKYQFLSVFAKICFPILGIFF
jgi:hypothetical protein